MRLFRNWRRSNSNSALSGGLRLGARRATSAIGLGVPIVLVSPSAAALADSVTVTPSAQTQNTLRTNGNAGEAPFTVTLKDSNGNPISGADVQWTVTSGPAAGEGGGGGPTDASGQETFSITSKGPGTDTFYAYADSGGAAVFSNIATVAWVAPKVTLAPSSQTQNALTSGGQAGTALLTATLTEADGTPISGGDVQCSVVSGPAVGEFGGGGNTDANGQRTCTITSQGPGTDTVKAIADAAGVPVDSNIATVNWLVPTTLTYAGATRGDYNDPATLKATLTSNISGAAVSVRRSA